MEEHGPNLRVRALVQDLDGRPVDHAVVEVWADGRGCVDRSEGNQQFMRGDVSAVVRVGDENVPYDDDCTASLDSAPGAYTVCVTEPSKGSCGPVVHVGRRSPAVSLQLAADATIVSSSVR